MSNAYARALQLQTGALEARYLEPGDIVLLRVDGAVNRTRHTVATVERRQPGSDVIVEFQGGLVKIISPRMPVAIVGRVSS